jgi:ABC-type nitrate/sulfonate/bicarbonate transport system substrate-binding protein
MAFVVPLIMYVVSGHPIVLLGGVHVGCFELFGTEQVRAIRDLKGKTVAVHSPLSASTVLTKALIERGLGSADAVEYQVVIGTTNRMAQLEAGEVDGISAFLSGAFQTVEQGYGRILDSPYGYDELSHFPVNLWFAPQGDIDENEEMYRVLVQEMQEAYRLIYDEDTEDIVSRALATDVNYPEFPEAVWHNVFELAAENTMWPKDYETNMSTERLNKSIDTLIDFGLIEEEDRLPPEDILDTRFVGEID